MSREETILIRNWITFAAMDSQQIGNAEKLFLLSNFKAIQKQIKATGKWPSTLLQTEERKRPINNAK